MTRDVAATIVLRVAAEDRGAPNPAKKEGTP
jgi:hypothetical protein